MMIKTFQNKKIVMKFTQLLISMCIVLVFPSCNNDPNSLSPINSESFHEKQIQIYFQRSQPQVHGSLLILTKEQNFILKELNEMLSMTDKMRKSGSNSIWTALIRKWTEFNAKYIGTDLTPYSGNDSSVLKKTLFPEATFKWVQLNADLVKFSGKVRFSDALEILLYRYQAIVFPEKLLKSVIFTHVFDQIYINIIGSSTMEYQHTTGGIVRIIQETNYPIGNEMILKSECNDLRYMDIFIRIPSWAVNPSVTHGNVKYVANPGEYCQISRKWLTGDVIKVILRN